MPFDNKIPIERIATPTPYQIGDIYSYLVLDEPITLIDVGVATEETREVWRQRLKELKLTVKDIKRIVLTHGHSDHYGLAREFAEASGAPILLHKADWEKVKNRRRFYQRMLPYVSLYGVPEEYLAIFDRVLEWEEGFCLDIPEEMLKPLEDGDTLEFEHITFTVHHVPGHSTGHVILMHRDWALSGDFIFDSFTPIPVIEMDERGNRLKTGLMYRDSLIRMKEAGLKRYYPSHRETEGDYLKALSNMKERMRYKEEFILGTLRRKGRCTPYEIIKELYPEHKPQEIYIVASDTLGRLDLLEEKGLVSWEERDGLVYYYLC